jgi:mRNA interferase MazF
MTYKRGSIYLANFNPAKGSEPGKVRPCLVIQNNALNEENHRTIAVIPLTTRLLPDGYPMRYPVNARDNLERDSQIMMDQIRSIDRIRFFPAALTKLTKEEMVQVEDCMKIVLGIE